jgi:hypothetical protein
MRYAFLNPIIEELAREDRIRIEGENITLVLWIPHPAVRILEIRNFYVNYSNK